MNTKKVLKYVLSLFIAVMLMYVSFREVDWAEFSKGLAGCNWRFVVLAMAASIAAFWFRSQRWRLLIRPFDPVMDSLTTFNGVNIGYLANFVFPRIGEVIRCGFISRRSAGRHKDDPQNAVSFENTIGTVLLSRTWDLAMIVILLAVLLALRWQLFGDFFTNQMWKPLAGRMDGRTIGILCGAAAALVALFIGLRAKLGGSLGARISAFVKGLADGFASCLKMENKAAFFGYTVMLWAMYWLMSMSIVWAMPQLEGLTWVDAWFICLAGSVAWIVPVPGGFGAYHGIVALAITSIYALDWDSGILYATLNHEAQAITMIVCGLVSYIIEMIRK